MAYLESKNVLHRDLACRNLLCQGIASSYQVKVRYCNFNDGVTNFFILFKHINSDFGLSRISNDGIYESSNRNLPIRWTGKKEQSIHL